MKQSSIIGLAALGGIGAVMMLGKKSSNRQSYSYYFPGYYDANNPTGYGNAYSNYPSGNVTHVPITPSPYIRPSHPTNAGALNHAVANQNSNALQYSVNPQTGRVQASYASPISMRASVYSQTTIPFRQSSGSTYQQSSGSNRPINTGIEDFIPQHYLPQRPAHNPIDYVYVTPVNKNFDPALAYVQVTPENPNFAPIDYVTVTPQNPNIPVDPLAYVYVTPPNASVDPALNYVQVTPQYQPIDYVQVTPQYQPIDYVTVTPQYYQPIAYVQVTAAYQPISYVDVTPAYQPQSSYQYVYSPPPQTYYSPSSSQNYYWTQPYYSQQNYYFSYSLPDWGSTYQGEAYFAGRSG